MTTNLGPLTTTFTPAPECTEVISGIIFTQTGTDGNTTTHKYHSLGPSDTSKCYPSGFEVMSAFYSPGRCPSGWSSACGSVYIASETITETTATCCPLGYTCKQAADETDTWSTLSCSSAVETLTNVTVPDDNHQTSKVTQLSHIMVNAAAITVRWQQTDFTASKTDTTTTSETTSSSSIHSISAPTSSNTSPASGDTGLSSNARIGIGVGAGLGSLLLILIGSVVGIGFWWRHRKAKEKANETTINAADPEATKSPAEMWALHQQELETSNNRHEMATDGNRHEISDTSRLAELPSNRWSQL
ncbi:uncharacterized protein GGS22DRAFT_164614 [Annulohypoxylon maeteangense]|uniref:uncharacterized protein n=1 Tax=Annulohypoxylon maeteangense TaxID=1927788 RepID=UPI002008E95B|nr:uncharacterized protein GGS22DRAFT_164614 [Annulohypoxylon maeteangense]KAI0884907.1 hypothetical protein GGS22DRAFT_164614 [Annulohypoxylon maeteangense]